jgi:acyl carrier protein
MTTLKKTTDIVRGFVQQRGADASSLQADTRLLQDGYVDSFSLVELIAYLEKELGIGIPDGALIPEDFETIATLHQRLGDL